MRFGSLCMPTLRIARKKADGKKRSLVLRVLLIETIPLEPMEGTKG